MTEDLLKGLWGILAGDLIGHVATYSPAGGGSPRPAIFTEPGPRGAPMPYVIIGGSAVPEESPASERMACTIDTYSKSGSAAISLRIGQRIEKLLDFKTPSIPGVTMLGITREAKGMVPEDDDEIQHLHQQFLIRYCRDDLY